MVESTHKSFQDIFAKEFMDLVNDAFFVFDYSLRFIYVNRKATQLTGKTKKNLLGKTVSEVFPEVKKKNIYIDFLKSRKFSKKPLEYYSPSMKKWLSVNVNPTKYGITVCAKDITLRKKAEDIAKESQNILNAFFEHSPVGLAIYDEDMKFLKLDAISSRKFFGKKAKNVIGKSLKTLAPESAKKIEIAFQEILKEDKSIISELSLKDKHGNDAHGLSSRFPLHFLNGKRGIGTITLDITDRVNDEQRKDDFIAMASHELKTPLTIAKIFIQVLQKKFILLKDESTSTLLQKVIDKIDQLEVLIKELLDATLVNNRRLSIKKEKFIFRDLAIKTISELQLAIQNKLVVEWRTHEYLHADKSRISQILINFITNAAKYSSGNKNIIIRSRRKGNFVIISVQDFGIGISKKDLGRIFDRFYQTSHDNTYPGLGLGLFIAKKIINENNGRIWVDSKEGKGSTFYFSLPIYKG